MVDKIGKATFGNTAPTGNVQSLETELKTAVNDSKAVAAWLKNQPQRNVKSYLLT